MNAGCLVIHQPVFTTNQRFSRCGPERWATRWVNINNTTKCMVQQFVEQGADVQCPIDSINAGDHFQQSADCCSKMYYSH